MSDSWKQWEGHTVDGAFPLLRYLGGSQRGAVFLTERREDGRAVPAAIKLVPSSAQEAELRLSRWRQAASLSHPRLIRLYETGRFELGALPLVYVIMELADENLGQALSERALSPEEARETLEGLLEVVGDLHSKGFVHGHIKPSNILAIDDQLKVSSDRACRVGEPLQDPGDPDEYDPPEYARGIIPVPERTSPAADIWSLGVTLIEMLTGNRRGPHAAGENPAPQALPQPFAEIASHCLRRAPRDRWDVAQIAGCLAGRTPIRTEAAQSIAAPGESAGKRHDFRVLSVAAAAALLVVIMAGLGWMRHRSNAERIPATNEPAIALEANQSKPGQAVAPSQPDSSEVPSTNTESSTASSSNAPSGSATSSTQSGTDPSAPSVSTRVENAKSDSPPPEPTRPQGTLRMQQATENTVTPGEVIHQVMPDVARSALDTIQGTVKVRVKLKVDQAGNVTDAEFESQGPSKYFARAAMQAAQAWKFKPAEASGREVPSSWELQFEFNHDGTKTVPTQTAR